jgi:hypothetical protein
VFELLGAVVLVALDVFVARPGLRSPHLGGLLTPTPSHAQILLSLVDQGIDASLVHRVGGEVLIVVVLVVLAKSVDVFGSGSFTKS